MVARTNAGPKEIQSYIRGELQLWLSTKSVGDETRWDLSHCRRLVSWLSCHIHTHASTRRNFPSVLRWYWLHDCSSCFLGSLVQPWLDKAFSGCLCRAASGFLGCAQSDHSDSQEER